MVHIIQLKTLKPQWRLECVTLKWMSESSDADTNC